MTSSHPPSTVAYPILTQLLDSILPVPVSSTSSTFTLPSSVSSATTTTSTSTLPPISSLMSTAVQTSLPFSRLLPLFLPLLLPPQLFFFTHTMLSPRLHICNSILPFVSSQMICNKESPAIQSALNCSQVKLVHPSEESSTLPFLNRNSNSIILLYIFMKII